MSYILLARASLKVKRETKMNQYDKDCGVTFNIDYLRETARVRVKISGTPRFLIYESVATTLDSVEVIS